MKKLLPLLLLIGGFSSPVMADITHTISASTQLRVDAAATDSTRIGSTYSVQGTNITAGTMGGLGQATNPAAATHSDGVYTVTTAGDAFSLTESFTGGDATNTIGTGVDVTAHTYTAATLDNSGNQTAPEINAYGTVTDLPAFGQTITSSGGYAGSLAGTIATDGAIGLTAGGAGTTATGQVVTTLTIQ
tara:strand:- start:456 stop:1022 length:567 start_codon:yes stop_codon:yes gene_type:complete